MMELLERNLRGNIPLPIEGISTTIDFGTTEVLSRLSLREIFRELRIIAEEKVVLVPELARQRLWRTGP